MSVFSQMSLAHDEGREGVARAAHDVADTSGHFHRAIHNITGYSHLATDAHRFTEVVNHFHHVIESTAPTAHVLRDYRQVQVSFRHLRTAFSNAHSAHHNHHVQNDWQGLTFAMEDLQYAVQDWTGGGHGEFSLSQLK